jgi:hypothetical protein
LSLADGRDQPRPYWIPDLLASRGLRSAERRREEPGTGWRPTRIIRRILISLQDLRRVGAASRSLKVDLRGIGAPLPARFNGSRVDGICRNCLKGRGQQVKCLVPIML